MISLALLAVAPLALAQHLAPPPGPWTAGAWNPEIGWFGNGINANGGAFWIGKDTASYCPANVAGINCSAYPGDSTVFIGGNDTLSLDVAVTGGQQVYVAPGGILGYALIDSGHMPNHSVVTGFDRFQSATGGAPVSINFEEQFFLACPVENATEVYQIFTAAGGKNACGSPTYFQMRTYTVEGDNAWAYV